MRGIHSSGLVDSTAIELSNKLITEQIERETALAVINAKIVDIEGGTIPTVVSVEVNDGD